MDEKKPEWKTLSVESYRKLRNELITNLEVTINAQPGDNIQMAINRNREIAAIVHLLGEFDQWWQESQ